MPIEVGVVSSRVLIRKGLCSLLAMMTGVSVVLELDNVLDNLKQIKQTHPQVLVLDSIDPYIDLPGLVQLRQLIPELKTLVITDRPDGDLCIRILKAGAAGCLSTRSTPLNLEKALEMVGRGDLWVDHQTANEIIGNLIHGHGATSRDSCNLTQREWEVLALLANGCRNKEIARRLFISEETTKTHLKSIYRKLNINTRKSAALHYFHRAQHREGGTAPTLRELLTESAVIEPPRT